MPVDIESSAGASGERDAGAPVYQVVDEDTGETYYTYADPSDVEHEEIAELLKSYDPVPVTADSPWYLQVSDLVIRSAEWAGGYVASFFGITDPMFQEVQDQIDLDRQRDEEERQHIQERQQSYEASATVSQPVPTDL